MENTKICQSCGRPFENRKKWKTNFDKVIYCSKRCQKNKKPIKFMNAILALVESRGTHKSICPSEILDGDDKKNKELMERVRAAGRLLASQDKIEIIQKGQVVHDFKGPIRFRLKK